jgi:hypothetical protein
LIVIVHAGGTHHRHAKEAQNENHREQLGNCLHVELTSLSEFVKKGSRDKASLSTPQRSGIRKVTALREKLQLTGV